jgi:DNA-directed RNA polymerase subunit M/transcription elongation factor TFIIS
MRSIIDEKIIAEWAERKARYKNNRKPFSAIILIILVVSVLLFSIFESPYLLIPLPFCVIYLVVDQAVANLSEELKCPKCGKHPVSYFGRESAFDVDFCHHCKSWLINPINNTEFYH